MTKLLIAVIFFFLAGTIFFAYVKPTYANFDVIKAQIAQYDDALQKARELDKIKQDLMQKRNNMNPNDLARLQVMLPDHADNIRLILELDSIANRYGMALADADIDTAMGPAKSQNPGAIVADAGSGYNAIQLHFTTFGSYDKFQLFMRDVEKSLRIVDLVSLSLTPQELVGFTYDVTIKTYWIE